MTGRTGTTSAEIVYFILFYKNTLRRISHLKRVQPKQALGRLSEILFIDLLKLKKGVRIAKNSLAVGVSRKTESPYKDNQTNEKIL